MLNYSDKEWERFGKTNPYYGVLTEEKYRRANLSDELIDEFFELGEANVENSINLIRQHFSKDFSPRRSLDFGCGVGRVLIPIARLSKEAVGVDISDSYIREAQANCEKHGVSNVSFAKSDDTLSQVTGEFDFVHSCQTFQHVHPRRGLKILAKLLSVLSDGGVGCLTFTFNRQGGSAKKLARTIRESFYPAHVAANIISGKKWQTPIMIAADYKLDQLFGALRHAGAEKVISEVFNSRADFMTVKLTFQKHSTVARRAA